MALTITAASRNAATDAVADLVDGGSADANGDLVLMTSGDVEVATLGLSNPAFGAASVGVCTAAAITNDSSATGGTVALFKVQNRDNTEIYRGTVGTVGSGADLEMSNLIIGAGDIVACSSLTLTLPATEA